MKIVVSCGQSVHLGFTVCACDKKYHTFSCLLSSVLGLLLLAYCHLPYQVSQLT